MPNSSPVASARESLDTIDARTSLPPAFAWSHAYSFATSFANFFAMPAVPDAAAEVSIDADDNETLGTAAGVATGAAGATTINDRPGPRRRGTVARIVWPDDGTLTSNCDPGGLSGGHVTLTRSEAGDDISDLVSDSASRVSSGPSTLDAVAPISRS